MRFFGSKNKNSRGRKTLQWVRKWMNKRRRSMFKKGDDESSSQIKSRDGWAWKKGRKGTLNID